MSCTEIYTFNQKGKPSLYAEIRNAHRGAMAIWAYMEEKYLPPYMPDWARGTVLSFKPSRCTADAHIFQEITDLHENPKVSETDKIVLKTTFDMLVVKKEDLPKVINAFIIFGAKTSLPEQAEILEKIMQDSSIIAVGWNQTSVCCDTWMNFGGYDKQKNCEIPYNLLTMTKHWFLFDNEKCGEKNEM